jgi:hypothetical protein
MENEKNNDQNRDGNPEKPKKSVFHLVFSYDLFCLNHLYRPMIGPKQARKLLKNESRERGVDRASWRQTNLRAGALI